MSSADLDSSSSKREATYIKGILKFISKNNHKKTKIQMMIVNEMTLLVFSSETKLGTFKTNRTTCNLKFVTNFP